MSWTDGEWGWCKYCGFLVPITPVPYLFAGCLEEHSAGKYAANRACEQKDRTPDPLPKGGVIERLARLDKQVMARVKKINKLDPRDDDGSTIYAKGH